MKEKIHLFEHPALGGFRRYEGQKTGSNPTRVLQEHKAIAERYNFPTNVI